MLFFTISNRFPLVLSLLVNSISLILGLIRELFDEKSNGDKGWIKT